MRVPGVRESAPPVLELPVLRRLPTAQPTRPQATETGHEGGKSRSRRMGRHPGEWSLVATFNTDTGADDTHCLQSFPLMAT